MSDKSRMELARMPGLPKASSWQGIDYCTDDIFCNEVYFGSGFPITSKWEDIVYYTRQTVRQQSATDLGLPRASCWEDIDQHIK